MYPQLIILMKFIKPILLILIFFFLSTKNSYSQTVNWESLKSDQKHIVSAHAGWDYAIVYGVSYGYQIKSKMPILLNVDFSIPAGEKVLEDFKTKIGAQFRLYKINHFQFSASIHGIYRRYETPLVRLQNFGSEMKGIAGYYKPKWFVAAEVGFDKAIVTHFKHSNLYRENYYADVKDGWYIPTGGNFSYGLQAGYSFKKSDILLRLGSVVTQNFSTKPTIPFYAEISYNFKILRVSK